jgi:hypothetical protein
MTYRGSGWLQSIATRGKNSHLDSRPAGQYGTGAAKSGHRCFGVRISVKNTLKVVAVLFALSLPMWANNPGRGEDKHKKRTEVPEGGNWPAYTIVSGGALLGGLLLARRQRATGTIANIN